MTTKDNSNANLFENNIKRIVDNSEEVKKEIQELIKESEKKIEAIENLKKLGLAFFSLGFGILISFLHAKVILEVSKMHGLDFISKYSITQIFIISLIIRTSLVKYRKTKDETYKEYLEKTKKIIVHSLLIISFLYFVGYILS